MEDHGSIFPTRSAEDPAAHHRLHGYTDIASRSRHLSWSTRNSQGREWEWEKIKRLSLTNVAFSKSIKLQRFQDKVPMSSCVCPTGKCSWDRICANPAPTIIEAHAPKIPFLTSCRNRSDKIDRNLKRERNRSRSEGLSYASCLWFLLFQTNESLGVLSAKIFTIGGHRFPAFSNVVCTDCNVRFSVSKTHVVPDVWSSSDRYV